MADYSIWGLEYSYVTNYHRITDDGLRITEICLADGEASKVS